MDVTLLMPTAPTWESDPNVLLFAKAVPTKTTNPALENVKMLYNLTKFI